MLGTDYKRVASDSEVALMKSMLRDVGLRPTRQRMALGWLLFAKGDRHITAEMLYEEASKAKVPVSLATVYNTLNLFVEKGYLESWLLSGENLHVFKKPDFVSRVQFALPFLSACEPETLGEMPVQLTRGVVVVGPVDQVAEIGPGLIRGLGPRQLAHPEGRGGAGTRVRSPRRAVGAPRATEAARRARG